MSSPPLTGRCNCGAVTFEITEAPTGATYCHCHRCQRRSGTAASAQIMVPEGSVRVLTGADEVRGWSPPDGMTKEFCGRCGSHLWSRPPGGVPRGVRMGVLDEDPGVRPTLRAWTSSAATWEPIPDDGLTRYEGPRP